MEMVFLILFAVAAVVDWLAVGRENRTIEYVAKPAALAFLLLYATTLPGTSQMLLAALLFSLLGDVYLMLPADLFLAGLGAFLLGHVAYVGAFAVSLSSRLLWFAVVRRCRRRWRCASCARSAMRACACPSPATSRSSPSW